jgi:hypothetical protein
MSAHKEGAVVVVVTTKKNPEPKRKKDIASTALGQKEEKVIHRQAVWDEQP